MKTGVKIAIIGAGSAQFSAGIVRDLCVTPGLHGSHVVLMDIDTGRLAAVYRLAERLAGETGADLSFSQTTGRIEAMRDADFVINTAQVGGHTWSEAQRSLAEKHGYYRGAHLHMVPQMLFFLEVARDMEKVCPHAWLIQSANPVFEGCTLMHRETSINVLGLCHGHYGYRDVARVLRLELAHVSAQMPGFNHWIWMTDFRYKGVDAYPLLEAWIETQAEIYWQQPRIFWDQQMSPAAIHQYRLFGRLPIGDTPRMIDVPRKVGWYYHIDLPTKQRWFGHQGGFDSELGWQEYLDMMAANVRQIQEVAENEDTPVTKTFAPVQSDEQIIPIIQALVNDISGIYQVNIPNRGILPGFPEDLVVECQGVVSGAGIRGVAVPPLPSRLMWGAMVPRWDEAETVVAAVRYADRNLLLSWLLRDQRTHTLEQAEGLLADWLAEPQNRTVAQHFGI